MRVVILNSVDMVAEFACNMIVGQIHQNPESVLGLATGSTPLMLYKRLINICREGLVSFKDVTTFNLDEYLGLPQAHPQTYRYYMHENFFKYVDIVLENTHTPQGGAADIEKACANYEALIATAGGVDLQLLGIGVNGHIGFNEPYSSFLSRTRVKALSRKTLEVNARFFSEGEVQPHLAITMGISTILESRKILLLATGENKASAVAAAVEGLLSPKCPASVLQYHADVTVVLDKAAASRLSPGLRCV